MALTSAEAEVRIVPSLKGFKQRVDAGVRATKAPDVPVNLSVNQTSLRKAQTEINRLGGVKIHIGVEKSGLQKLHSQLSSVNRASVNTATSVTAIGAAAAGLSSATGAVGALGVALVTASGAAALLPGALLAAGAAYGAMKVGMSGVKDALDGDAEALARLAPSARAAVNSLTGLRGAWDGVKNSVQGQLFEGLGAQISDVAKVQLPVLKTGLTDIAAGFNLGALRVAGFLRSSVGVSNVTRILDGTAGATRNLAAGAGGVTAAVTGIGAVGAEWLPRLTAGFDQAAIAAGKWVNSAEGQARINELISQGLSAIGDLANLVGNVGSILGGVFSAMQAAGSTTIQTLVDLTGQMASWVHSAEGSRFLIDLFTNIKLTIDNLRPALAVVAGAIVNLVNQVAPHLPGLASGFSAVAQSLQPVLDWLGRVAGVVAGGLSWLLNTAPGLVAGLATAFGALWVATKAVSIWTSLATVRTVAYHAVMLLVRGATALWTGAQWLLNAAMRANPIGLVITAITALIAGVIWAYNNVGWFRDAVNFLWGKMKEFGAWIASAFTATLRVLSAVFSSVWNWIKTTAVSVWNGIAAFFTGAWATLSATWNAVWGGISSFFSGIWNGIKSVAVNTWNAIWNFLSGAVRGFATFFSDTWRGIVDGFGRTWDRLKELAKTPVRFVIDTVLNAGIGGLWNAAAGLFGLDKWKNFPLPAGFATGGAVRGPGGPTADRIPAVLSNGEHVLDARDVKNLGGHGGVYALREAAARGMLPRFAQGGPVTWQELRNTVLGALPGTRMSSGYRPGAPGEHGKGLAADFTGNLPAIQNWIASRFPGSHEIIGPVERQNIFNGRHHRYNAATVAGHKDHVHWSHFDNKQGLLSRAGEAIGNAWDTVVSWVSQLTDKIAGPESWLRGAFGGYTQDGSTISKLPGAAGEKLLSVAKDFLFGKAEAMDSAGGFADGGPTTGDMLGNARVIANVGRQLGFGRNGIVVALATALQESGLRNLNYGDRDSLGVFQQRPSMGWGSPSQLLNVSYAASKFFSALRGVRGWESLPVTVAAQRVQRSAFPDAYQKWVGKANSLASQVGFSNGGVIPGRPNGRDDKLALVSSGERVLTDSQWNVASAAVRQVTSGHGLDGFRHVGASGKTVNINNDNKFVETIDVDRVMSRAAFLAGSI